MTNFNERTISEIITIAENAIEHLSEYCIADADCESIETGAKFDEALVLNDLQQMIAQIIKCAEKMQTAQQKQAAKYMGTQKQMCLADPYGTLETAVGLKAIRE